MRLIERLGWKLAVRKCARRLAPALQQRHGPSPLYTIEQIEAAARAVGLSPRYAPLAYAVFLAEDDFRRAVHPSFAGDYRLLRRLYRREVASRRRGHWGEGGGYAGDGGGVDGAGNTGRRWWDGDGGGEAGGDGGGGGGGD